MSTIAFIGLGIMGSPMACHLAQAGHTVIGYDRSPNAPRPWSRRAARRPTPSNRPSRAPTSWRSWSPTPPTCRAVLLGDNGVFAHAQPGTLVIDFSSIRPDVTAELARLGAQRGLRIIDAPVSGGEPGAKNATLSIMVGGVR